MGRKIEVRPGQIPSGKRLRLIAKTHSRQRREQRRYLLFRLSGIMLFTVVLAATLLWLGRPSANKPSRAPNPPVPGRLGSPRPLMTPCEPTAAPATGLPAVAAAGAPDLEESSRPPADLLAQRAAGVVWRLPESWDWENVQSNGFQADASYSHHRFLPAVDQPPVRLDGKQPGEMPLLLPWQTAVVDLPPLPPANYVLCVSLTRGNLLPQQAPRPWLATVPAGTPAECAARRGDFLKVRFNGKLVWARWRCGTEAVIRALVPFSSVNSSRENEVVIDNATGWPLAVDTLWMERSVPGEPLRVVLDGGSWVSNPEVAEALGWVGVHLRAEPYPSIRFAEETAGPEVPWRTCDERREAWRQTGYPLSPPSPGNSEQRQMYGIAQTLWLDCEPVAVIDQARIRQLPKLMPAITALRPFVRCWLVDPAANEPAAELLAAVRAALPQSVVLPAPYFRRRPEPEWRMASANASARQLEAELAAAVMADREDNCLTADGALPWLDYCDLGLAHSVNMQRKEALRAARQISAWLDMGGNGVLIRGGGFGNGPFVQGDRRLGESWDGLAAFCRLGTEGGRRIDCSVVPADGQYGTTEARWAAVQHDGPRVTWVCFAGDDSERQFTVTIPVNWTSKYTYALVHELDMQSYDKPFTRSSRTLKLPTQLSPAVPGGGYVTLDLTMPSLCSVRLWAEGTAAGERVIQPLPAAEKDARFSFRQDLLSVVSGPTEFRGARFEDLGWPGLEARSMSDDDVSAVNVPATPGEIGRLRNLMLRAADSLQMTLRDVSASTRPDGVCIHVRPTNDRHFERLVFWVRASSSRGFRRVPLLVGSSDAAGRVDIATGVWLQISAPWQEIFPGRDNSRLYVYALPGSDAYQDGGTVTFEFNAIGGVGRCTERGVSVDSAVRHRWLPDTAGNGSLRACLLLGTPGKALYEEIRFETPVEVADVESSLPDLEWNYAAEARLLTLKHPQLPQVPMAPELWRSVLNPDEFHACMTGQAYPVKIVLSR